MRLAPTRVIAPTAPLLTVGEVKAHARVEHDDEDGLIAALVAAVEARLDGCDGALGRALVTQTWEQRFDGWYGAPIAHLWPASVRWTRRLDHFHAPIRLALSPVQSIAAVTYLDPDGATQTLAASAYTLEHDALGAIVRVDDGPTVKAARGAVTVRYVAGYGEPSDVPAAIRQAALMIAAHLYEHREAVAAGVDWAETPMAARWLLEPYRRLGTQT